MDWDKVRAYISSSQSQTFDTMFQMNQKYRLLHLISIF